jgi:hypothetical protein
LLTNFKMLRNVSWTCFGALFCLSLRLSAGGLACYEAQGVALYSLKISPQNRQLFEQQKTDTVQGLEALRGSNGLLVDTTWVRNHKDGQRTLQVLNGDTSPTNIAVDLLVQVELTANNQHPEAAQARAFSLVETLEQVEFHKETGLFFSRYSSDTVKPQVRDACVSSIDNLHLAIALWTLHQQQPSSEAGIKALQLFRRMDFSVYYDPKSGLIGGNLRPHEGIWEKEAYNLANLGSEGRLLYSVGWALGLYRNAPRDEVYLNKAFGALKVEFHQTPEGQLMKLWDGSAFQLYFPRIFANEDIYSVRLQKNFVEMGNFMIAEGRRQNLPWPAAFNAIRVGTHESIYQGTGSIYRDKSGNIELVSSDNEDVHNPVLRDNWEGTVAPSAMVMAAAASPTTWAPVLSQLRETKSGDDPLYINQLGWMEGLHVRGDQKDQVVASQLSLNQGMMALSLFQIGSPDGLSTSARALRENEGIRAKLKSFYEYFDRLESAIQKK